MDDQTRVYWLMRVLNTEPGFACRPNGLFEFWGVPLHEIPESVFPDDSREAASSPRGLTRSQADELFRRVLAWLAARHMEAVN